MTRSCDVVVVTYESAVDLPACLQSLPGWVRVIVVDNASKDESATIAERFGATVVRNATNRGFAAAVNQGVALGDGELVLLLNPDAVVDEANLNLLVEALKEDGVGIVGPRLIMPDGSEQRPFWPFPSPRGQWRTALAPSPRVRREGPGFVVGACLLTTRMLWDKLGGLDESFWLYGEEADFCRRVYDLGYHVRLVETATVDHIGGVSGKALGEVTFEHFVRGSERFVFKHHGPAGLVSYRLGAVVRHGLRSIVRRGPSGEVDRANLRRSAHALRHHPTLVHVPDIKRGNEIILASLEPWDDVWRRNQFLVRELVEADSATRLLWVEPAHDVLHAVRSGVGRTRPRGRLVPLPGSQQITLFQPTKLLPRRVWPWTDRDLSRQVRRAANQLGLVDPVLWLNDPSLTPLTGETAWPVVYDITDDWLDAEGTDRNLWRLREYETTLLRRANRVVVHVPEHCRPASLVDLDDVVIVLPCRVQRDDADTRKPSQRKDRGTNRDRELSADVQIAEEGERSTSSWVVRHGVRPFMVPPQKSRRPAICLCPAHRPKRL